jgi:hypothetical protein
VLKLLGTQYGSGLRGLLGDGVDGAFKGSPGPANLSSLGWAFEQFFPCRSSSS